MKNHQILKIVSAMLVAFVVVALAVFLVQKYYNLSPMSAGGVPGPVSADTPFGVVTQMSGSNFTIQGVGTSTLVVVTNAQTQFTTDTGARASASQVVIGSLMTVISSTPNSDGSITALVVRVTPPPSGATQ